MRKLIIAFLFFALSQGAFSQNKWLISLSPGADFIVSQKEQTTTTGSEYGAPTTINIKELNKSAYFSFNASIGYGIEKNIVIGINSGFVKYDNYSAIPLQALGRYTFNGKNLQPFIELKAGTNFLNKSGYIGNVNIGIGSGILIKINPQTGLRLGIEYKFINPDGYRFTGGYQVGNETSTHKGINASIVNLNIGLDFNL